MTRRRVRFPILFALGLALGIPSVSSATTISATLTADDTFAMYLSTVDSVLGTQVCADADNWWPTPQACAPTALTPNTTYFLHLVVSDIFGPPSMVIGTFNLSDALFQFSNGTQSLNTNATNWVARVGSFAGANLTPLDLGPNGTGPWGNVAGVSPSARFIWEASGQGCTGCTRYFSTTITPTQASAVPEPGTFLLVGCGIAAAVAARRRLSKRAS